MEISVGCMGTQALEWDGITLPAKVIRSEKERKTLRLLLGYSSLLVKLEELFSLTTEAVCLGRRDSVSPAEEELPTEAGPGPPGKRVQVAGDTSAFCYAKALMPKPLFDLMRVAL